MRISDWSSSVCSSDLPVDELPGEDPVAALPSALSAALKGLAHELRNPLAGLKGAAQLLARRAGDEQSRELTELIGSEVDRLAQLVDRLLSPAPPQPHAALNIHAVPARVLRLAASAAGLAVELVVEIGRAAGRARACQAG